MSNAAPVNFVFCTGSVDPFPNLRGRRYFIVPAKRVDNRGRRHRKEPQQPAEFQIDEAVYTPRGKGRVVNVWSGPKSGHNYTVRLNASARCVVFYDHELRRIG